MDYEDKRLIAHKFSSNIMAHQDAVLAFRIDAMVSRRPRRPISLPRPPLTRGR